MGPDANHGDRREGLPAGRRPEGKHCLGCGKERHWRFPDDANLRITQPHDENRDERHAASLLSQAFLKGRFRLGAQGGFVLGGKRSQQGQQRGQGTHRSVSRARMSWVAVGQVRTSQGNRAEAKNIAIAKEIAHLAGQGASNTLGEKMITDLQRGRLFDRPIKAMAQIASHNGCGVSDQVARTGADRRRRAFKASRAARLRRWRARRAASGYKRCQIGYQQTPMMGGKRGGKPKAAAQAGGPIPDDAAPGRRRPAQRPIPEPRWGVNRPAPR